MHQTVEESMHVDSGQMIQDATVLFRCLLAKRLSSFAEQPLLISHHGR